jgi:hypothetical protein
MEKQVKRVKSAAFALPGGIGCLLPAIVWTISKLSDPNP